MKHSITLLFLGLLGYAAPVVSPESIIVNPVPSGFKVEVWVDKDPTGLANPAYQIGENIIISAMVNQDAYVYLFSVKSTGQIGMILPNPYDRDNFLKAGQVRRFPAAAATYSLTVGGPEGQDRVLAVASKRPLSLSEIAEVQSGTVRVQGADSLAKALSVIVSPLPDKEWVSDTIFFVVGRFMGGPQPAPIGTLSVTSNPAGAQVLVDGQLLGTTPLLVTIGTGQHTVEVRSSGYDSFSTTVNLTSGQTLQVSANLVAQSRAATVMVNSTPQGAQVFVNGALAGTTPINLSLLPGRYDIELRLAGYQTFKASVNLTSGQTVQVNAPLVALVRGTGDLYVTSLPDRAEVYINGQRVGVTPLRLSLPEGSYDLRVVRGNMGEYRSAVKIEGGKLTRVEARLAGFRIAVEFFSNVEVRVFVDGVEVGQTKGGYLRLELATGKHQVVALAPGYQVYVATIRVNQGQMQPIRAALKKLDESGGN